MGQSSEHFLGSWASRVHAGLGPVVSVTCSPPPTQPSLEPAGRKGGDGALALPGPGWAFPHLHHLLQDRIQDRGPGLHLCKLSLERSQDSLKVTQQGRGGSQVCLLSQALSLCGWVGFVSTPTLPATFLCLLVLLAFLSLPNLSPVTCYDLPILGNTPASGAPIPLLPFLGVTFPRSHSWRWPSTMRVWVCSMDSGTVWGCDSASSRFPRAWVLSYRQPGAIHRRSGQAAPTGPLSP